MRCDRWRNDALKARPLDPGEQAEARREPLSDRGKSARPHLGPERPNQKWPPDFADPRVSDSDASYWLPFAVLGKEETRHAGTQGLDLSLPLAPHRRALPRWLIASPGENMLAHSPSTTALPLTASAGAVSASPQMAHGVSIASGPGHRPSGSRGTLVAQLTTRAYRGPGPCSSMGTWGLLSYDTTLPRSATSISGENRLTARLEREERDGRQRALVTARRRPS